MTDKQPVAIVNVTPVIRDEAWEAAIPALQAQLDNDFVPSWGELATPLHLIFVGHGKSVPKDAWPIFLNRHSSDPGALGWHTKEGLLVYGRVFVGDCMRFGVSPVVDLSHEILETSGDPSATKVFTMPDGRLAAFEACDAVESDDFGYATKGHEGFAMSDFVMPWYFSAGHTGLKYDFKGHLKTPCPGLTTGGYMSVTDKATGEWGQLDAMKHDNLRGRRSLMVRFRNLRRAMPKLAA